jgi:hypothetical protein
MARLICLANSWRPGGRCVAGIDCATGKWVRPVPHRGGAIPAERTWLGAQCLGLLDIVEIQLEAPTFETRFQCENCKVRTWNWRLAGRARPADLLKCCAETRTVLHGPGKVVEPCLLERLPPQQWASLQLVHVTKVHFDRDTAERSRWHAKFSLSSCGPDYRIKLTDPDVTLRLNAGEQIKPECLLTVSLTEPIKVHDKPALCYKLVAGVIELGDFQP